MSKKFKVGDVITIKRLKTIPKDWEEEHLEYMGKTFTISHIDNFGEDIEDTEIHVKGVKDFYFIENEIMKPIKFKKLKSKDFELL